MGSVWPFSMCMPSSLSIHRPDHPRHDVIPIFQDVLLPVSVFGTSLIRKVGIYLPAKFRRDISIHG